jgi:hypothetical protein
MRGSRGEPITVNTGRILIKFTGYVMQQKHFDLLMKMQDSEVLDFINIMTKETFDAMSKDLQKYLEEEKPTEMPRPKTVFELPFSAFIKPIFGSMKKFNTQAKDVLKKMPKMNLSSKDIWNIARLKLVAQEKAKKDTNTVFRVYRLTNRMLAAPESKQ